MSDKKSIIEKHYGVDVHKPFMMRENYCKSDHLPFGSPHLPFEKPAVKCAESVHLNIMQSEFINNIFKGHDILIHGGKASGKSYITELLKTFGFK